MIYKQKETFKYIDTIYGDTIYGIFEVSPIMLSYNNRGRQESILLVAVLVVSLSISPIGIINQQYADELLFVRDIYVVAEAPSGDRIGSAMVYLFEMSDNGDWVIIGKTYTGSAGIALFKPILSIPLSSIGNTVNLMVVAVKGSYIGLYSFSLDYSPLSKPTYVHVKMFNLNQTNNNMRKGLKITFENNDNTIEKYTTVLKYSTCNGIYAQWHYPIDAKIRVQSKWRWPPGSGSWIDGGYTTVTLDLGTVSNTHSGNYIRIVQFQIKYKDAIIPIGGIAIEKVYAIDTDNDGGYYRKQSYPWSCTPTTGSKSAIIYQGDTKEINVTGGEEYDFYVTVSFSYPWATTVTLGVDKTPAPRAILTLSAGYKSDPSYIVKIVSLGDSDYLNSRAFWIRQP